MWSRTGPTNHGKSTGCIPRGCPTNRWVYPKVQQSGNDGKMKMNHHSLHGKMIGNTIGFGSTTVSDLAMDQYLLIPFLGGWTSINPSYFWCSPGVQGFDPSPSDFFLIETMPSGHCTGPSETIPCNLTLEKWRVGSDGNSHGCPMYASPVVRFPFLCYIYIYVCIIYKTTLYIHTCIIHIIYICIHVYIYIYTWFSGGYLSWQWTKSFWDLLGIFLCPVWFAIPKGQLLWNISSLMKNTYIHGEIQYFSCSKSC